MMQRPSPTRKITSPQCGGKGKMVTRWINPDLRERAKVHVCKRCEGKGEIEIARSYQDD